MIWPSLSLDLVSLQIAPDTACETLSSTDVPLPNLALEVYFNCILSQHWERSWYMVYAVHYSTHWTAFPCLETYRGGTLPCVVKHTIQYVLLST